MTRDDANTTEKHPSHALNLSPNDLAIDPVCGQVVDPTTVTTHRRHQGTTYHFCCRGCRALFDAEPDAYHAGHGHTPQP